MTVVPDYLNQHLGLIQPVEGSWPPLPKRIYLDRGSVKYAQAQVGDIVEIKLGDETIRRAEVGGIIKDGYASMASPLGIYGVVSMETLEWFHEPVGYNTVLLSVKDLNASKAEVEAIAKQVADQLNRSGVEVYYTLSFRPGENPGASQILGVVAVIGILGFLTIALAGFLIFNTLSALITQHVRYIGIMKAIGGQTSQIFAMYLVLISLYSSVAVIFAIPLSSNLAFLVASIMATQFNYDSLGFRIIPQAILWQILIGYGVPILSGFIPILQGVRITIREALLDYGLGKGQFGKNMIDRGLGKIRFFSRPTLISIRNTFRRKGRLLRTLSTLALGGAIFIGVFNLRQSLIQYIEQVTRYFLSDVTIVFNQYYPLEKINRIANEIAEIEHVEGWASITGDLMKDPKTAEETIAILAPPADSQLIEPIMISGRWILPEDENAIVVNNAFWRVRPDLKVGDILTIRIQGRLTDWKIVGFFKFPGDYQLIAYGNYEYVSQLIGTPKRSAEYRLMSSAVTPLEQKSLAEKVEKHFKSKGLQVAGVQTGAALVEANISSINIIISFFLFNAILIALVGGIGLMGTMSMNVLERSREIGVLRAIGASSRSIFSLVLTEGMVIGFLSWALSLIIAIPISRLMFDVLMIALFRSSGNFKLSLPGFIIWFGIMIVISWLACLIPARNASRMTIREVLAYE
ncbi:MAG: Macrolide export ATP-binding/permease protein MacB [Anaerolineae bacterium]|nr:MAG: Macrolide export ATP-binding/permease protein MacB [Anaerolineae bacterium]